MTSSLLGVMDRRTVLFDGAMGTSIHSCEDCRPQDWLGGSLIVLASIASVPRQRNPT